MQVTHSNSNVQWDQHADLKPEHEKNAKEVRATQVTAVKEADKARAAQEAAEEAARKQDDLRKRAEAEAAQLRDESKTLAEFRQAAAAKLQAAKLAAPDAPPADLLAALDKGLRPKPAPPPSPATR